MGSDSTILALEEQLGCYRRLAKLAEAQHEHVQQSRTDSLLEVLSMRQQVLEEIARYEKNIGPARRRWSDYLAGLDSGSRVHAEDLLAETRRLLEQITAADRNDALILQQRKLNLGKELGQARTTRQVNKAYAAAAYGKRASHMDVQQ